MKSCSKLNCTQLNPQPLTNNLPTGIPIVPKGGNAVVNPLTNASFTIAGTKVFEVQHRCDVTGTSNGFGVEVSWGTEIYTSITIAKVA